MVLEGAMIVVAASCLTWLHPGVAFQGAWSSANFTFRKRTMGAVEKSVGTPEEGVFEATEVRHNTDSA